MELLDKFTKILWFYSLVEWAKVDESKKKALEEAYKIEKQAFIETSAQYENKLTEDQRGEIYDAKMKRNEMKERRAIRQVRITSLDC